MTSRARVVVVGGGFAGLAVTRGLCRAPVDVVLVDRSNHHLFQPLLYQVAMAGLGPAEIAVPIRSVLREQPNARVLLTEVTGVDLATRRLFSTECPPLPYDFLVLAPGARTSYFGHDDWAKAAPGLKDLDDAVEIRRRVLLAFEAAEREEDGEARRRHLTFVVIGGGPTGVELAGAIAELATSVLARDFRAIQPGGARIVLVEGDKRVLASFDPELSAYALTELRHMGIEVRLATRVTAIDELGVTCGAERIESSTVLWGAGVRAAPLAGAMGLAVDKVGRVVVEPDCSVPAHREVFCIGDAAAFVAEGDERPLPGVSPVAMQQGRYVAKQIALDVWHRSHGVERAPRERFRYVDKGVMATIGRSRAVARVGNLRMSGFIAWLAWLVVHITYLIDFRNRVLVLIDWAWAYFTYGRGSRLITGHRLDAGAPESSPSAGHGTTPR